ncbi:T9SS type A sorting domain-containing protein [Psychroserpens sp. BH13MA-6]
MKSKLLLLLLLLPVTMLSQVGNGFENTPGVNFSAVGGSCQYFDFETATAHTLANYNAPCGLIYVTESSNGATLGYAIELDPTSPNGPSGFSDGDFFGVGTSAFFTTEIAVAPPEGSQAFFMEDPDGDITMTFDLVDLAGASNPQFSMQYILEETSWELEDFFRVQIVFTDCASSTLTLIDTFGSDIDDLAIEDTWNMLTADLSSYVGCKAQLVIEFSSNSAAEELGLDAISFSSGVTLSTPTSNLTNLIEVYANPTNGSLHISNSGIALHALSIVDINGRLVFNEELNNTTLDVQYELGHLLSPGMYVLSIATERTVLTKKIIIASH